MVGSIHGLKEEGEDGEEEEYEEVEMAWKVSIAM